MAAGGTTAAIARETKAVSARLTGVTETAGAETGIPETQKREREGPEERRAGNAVRLLSHETLIFFNWNWTDVDVAGNWEHR